MHLENCHYFKFKEGKIHMKKENPLPRQYYKKNYAAFNFVLYFIFLNAE